jgi:hypothetical protein
MKWATRVGAFSLPVGSGTIGLIVGPYHPRHRHDSTLVSLFFRLEFQGQRP